MNLYNELNAYSEEIDVFKIPLSSIDNNCLCATEQHELQLLKKLSLIYASIAGDGINLCYRISYGDKKVDSDFISKTEQFELREILKKRYPTINKNFYCWLLFVSVSLLKSLFHTVWE